MLQDLFFFFQQMRQAESQTEEKALNIQSILKLQTLLNG